MTGINWAVDLETRRDRRWAYLQLMRPANVVTAWADILAGFAASGAAVSIMQDMLHRLARAASLEPLAWLLLATTGLYGGGIVFNDYFDAELDAHERPERPIPSGRASRQGAACLGGLLFVVGILAATQVSLASASLAVTIACSALLYNAWAKHHPVSGPLTMGCCRAGNLLLGISTVPGMLGERWFVALIPLFYIAAITSISRGEVQGGKDRTGAIALFLLSAVLDGVLVLGLLPSYVILAALPFWLLLAARVLPPFVRANRNPNPELIRTAVKAGVLSLILLDATVAAGFAGWFYGLLVLSLLPISIALAQRFAVT